MSLYWVCPVPLFAVTWYQSNIPAKPVVCERLTIWIIARSEDIDPVFCVIRLFCEMQVINFSKFD